MKKLLFLSIMFITLSLFAFELDTGKRNLYNSLFSKQIITEVMGNIATVTSYDSATINLFGADEHITLYYSNGTVYKYININYDGFDSWSFGATTDYLATEDSEGLLTEGSTGYIKVYIQDDGDVVTDGTYYIPFYSAP
jgi:hypothetical protein